MGCGKFRSTPKSAVHRIKLEEQCFIPFIKKFPVWFIFRNYRIVGGNCSNYAVTGLDEL
jgi:hypothetical protein